MLLGYHGGVVASVCLLVPWFDATLTLRKPLKYDNVFIVVNFAFTNLGS